MIALYNPSLAWWLMLAREALPMMAAYFGAALALTLAVWAGVEVWKR